MEDSSINNQLIWIINPFDPLPQEGKRAYRYQDLREILIDNSFRVRWFSSSFDHNSKTYRNQKNFDRYIELIPNIGYQSNISILRVLNHVLFAINLYFKMLIYIFVYREKPDIIISSFPPILSNVAVLWISRLCGAKFVIDVQDAWPEAFFRFIKNYYLQKVVFFIPTIVRNYCLDRADIVSVTSPEYMTMFNTKKRDHFILIPIGSTMRNLHLARDKGAIVYIGSMSTNYDLETLIYAFQKIPSHRNATLHIAGQGDKEKSLKNLTSDLNLDNIIFHGHLNETDLENLLNRCSIGVNPINPESFSYLTNKIADYIATGLYVINSIDGEIRCILSENQVGTYYQARSVSSMVSALESSLSILQSSDRAIDCEPMYMKYFNRHITYNNLVRIIKLSLEAGR